MTRLGPRLACSLLLIGGGCGSAAATVTSDLIGGALTATSDAADGIAITCPAGNVLVNGANPGTGAAACTAVTQLQINGGPGANTIDISAATAAAFPNLAGRSVLANGGDDVITGSPLADAVNAGLGADIFIGDDGDDTFTGGDGNDTALLGAGNDLFVWSPGDDNDTIEGQSGIDLLRFNGANAAEAFDVMPNGGRIILFRNVAAVTMDLNDVEQFEILLLGGADVVTLADTSGTDLLQLRLDLAAGGGGDDGQPDSIVVNGSAGADTFALGPISGGLAVTRGAQAVQVVGAQPLNDVLRVNGLDAGDNLTAGIAVAGLIGITLDGGAGTDTAVASGSGANDAFRATVNAGVINVAIGGVALFAPVAAETLRIDCLGGNDTVTTTGGPGALTTLFVDGGNGNDTLLGGLGSEIFVGGDGDDTFTGGDGNDLAFLGADNDVFIWNPGDDNDTIEGQSGTDLLRFNGANAAENIDVLANGGRVLFLRNVAIVTIDLDDVEQIDFAALGGADNVTLGDVTGTDLTQLRVDLRAGGGGGDAAADTIAVNATSAGDSITFAASGSDAVLSVAPITVTAVGAELASDTLRVNALGGNDTLTAAFAASALPRLTFDAGASAGTGDLAVVTGDALAETYTIAPIAADVRVGRSLPAVAVVDLVATERLQLDTLAGADAVTTQFLATTSQALDGGDPTTFPGDTLAVSGFAGDVTASPLVQAGSGPIVHAKFEFGVFDGFLTGGQVVPPNASPGRGTARVGLTPAGDAINILLSFQGLAGANTLTHIHGPAPRGANAAGAPLFVLPNSGATSGSFSAGPLAITPAQKAQLEAGQLYIDVHSVTFPNGEIRGQLDSIHFTNGFENP